ncbi:MAG: phosphotransferase [Pirellulales bacterium]|nr:phosphotransferase [Pirellulales bacterium]
MDTEVPLEVLKAFGLGPLEEVRRAGGTASPKWSVRTPQGRFMVRARPADFADEASLKFDHAALRRLGEAGLPVPAPLAMPGGSTWILVGERVYEVLSWVAADSFDPADLGARTNLGRFLALFHRALSEDMPPGKQGRLREDHPALLEPYLDGLRELAATSAQCRQLGRIGEQLDLVRTQLDAGLYASLPHCVVHGDLHPGNLRFRNSQVAGVYDFDYLNVQARARDLSDALMFFASNRNLPLDPDDIRSLTQPFVPDRRLAGLLIGGYEETTLLAGDEWSALPLLMRSRWIQMRLRGSRKVHPEEKLPFVLDRFFEVTDWLEAQGSAWFENLREDLS